MPGTIDGKTLTNVTISSGTITGITDLAVADGGTGASNASGARTNLGLAIGTDVQAYDPQLADIAGLTPSDNNFIVGTGTNFVTESGSTARTSLGLGSIATQDSNNVTITGGSISGVTFAYTTPLTIPGTSSSTGEIRLAEDTDNGTNYVGLKAPAAITSNLSWTLPAADGLSGQFLSTDGSGALSWQTPGGAGDVVGPSSATDNAAVRFDTTTGKLVQNSVVTIGDTGAVAGVSSLTMGGALSGVTTLGMSGDLTMSGTGQIKVATGTTGERSGSPTTGMFRFNTSLTRFEGYNGTAWSGVGTGAVGGSADLVFFENDITVTANYTITTNKNAMSAGPITINSGVTVTVPSGSTWTVV